MPDSGVESWTVLGDDHAPVEPVERWLAYLTLVERSPNTVKAYAHVSRTGSASCSCMAWTGAASSSRI